jgi:hypothetical protein
MDSEAFVAASLLWVDLIVFHQNIDTLRLALYKINVNWQNYEQEIMPHSQLTSDTRSLFFRLFHQNYNRE